jgi:predicted acyltransferase
VRAMPRKRDVSVDALRGVAVFTMIASNLAAEVMSGSHPFCFVYLGHSQLRSSSRSQV